ncbi:phosphoribosylformylglycinamidine synthase subunit PurQ, partial [Acinetobacter baumannii]
NGFQVLTQLGLLPFPQTGAPRVVSLARNREKRFHNKWVSLDVSKSKSADIFFKGLERIDLPIRHGEGNLTLEPHTPETTENSKNT